MRFRTNMLAMTYTNWPVTLRNLLWEAGYEMESFVHFAACVGINSSIFAEIFEARSFINDGVQRYEWLRKLDNRGTDDSAPNGWQGTRNPSRCSTKARVCQQTRDDLR